MIQLYGIQGFQFIQIIIVAAVHISWSAFLSLGMQTLGEEKPASLAQGHDSWWIMVDFLSREKGVKKPFKLHMKIYTWVKKMEKPYENGMIWGGLPPIFGSTPISTSDISCQDQFCFFIIHDVYIWRNSEVQ